MTENIIDDCTTILDLIIQECKKRGDESKECILLKMILNRKCMNNPTFFFRKKDLPKI